MQTDLAGKRIVIMEDEAIALMSLRKICIKAGMEVVGIAGNGKDGVEIALREKPDIVMTDISMPILSGIDAALQILDQLPVCMVFLSAHVEEAATNRVASLGIHGYLLKPISAADLIPALIAAYENCQQGQTLADLGKEK